MRSILIVVAYVLSSLGFGSGIAAAQSKVEQEVMQIENDWCTAEVKRDVAAYGQIIADEYTGIGSRGTTETKAQSIASLKDTANATTSCVNSNMKVRVFGDAAVVTGLVTRAGSNKGAPYGNRQVLFTDVWVRRASRWQCVASQGTVAAAQQK